MDEIDSREWWRRSYGSPAAINPGTEPSDLAVALSQSLTAPSRILELGCGPGIDSVFFARSGHRVVAADFVRLDADWHRVERATHPDPAFVLLDLRAYLPFAESSFDVVYARLSLHYFTDKVTGQIFREIHRVLADDGVLTFLCKTTSDPLFGLGEALGSNMFRIGGKVYHFFDEAFALRCLGNRFHVEELWSGPMETFGEPSNCLRVRARKIETALESDI
jgi:SAM-dependent methyltransferase